LLSLLFEYLGRNPTSLARDSEALLNNSETAFKTVRPVGRSTRGGLSCGSGARRLRSRTARRGRRSRRSRPHSDPTLPGADHLIGKNEMALRSV